MVNIGLDAFTLSHYLNQHWRFDISALRWNYNLKSKLFSEEMNNKRSLQNAGHFVWNAMC